MGVTVVAADTIVPREQLEEIERLQAFSFSAATFEICGRNIVVTNPLRTPARTARDLAHELSHLRLEHQLAEVREINGIPFRTCAPDQEEQATALGRNAFFATATPDERRPGRPGFGRYCRVLRRHGRDGPLPVQHDWRGEAGP